MCRSAGHVSAKYWNSESHIDLELTFQSECRMHPECIVNAS